MKIGSSVRYKNKVYVIKGIFHVSPCFGGKTTASLAIRNEEGEKCVLRELCELV